MSQNIVDFSGNPTGAGLMDDYLDKDQQNILTSNSGIQRPSYAVAGTKWLDMSATPWLLKMYDGTNDVVIGTVNPSTHKFIASIPLTTTGDLIVQNKNGKPDRLASGTAGTVLTSNGIGQVPSWQKSPIDIKQDLTNPSANTVPSTKAVADESSRKVSKTGDTMTGTLTNNGVFVSQFDSINYIARSKSIVKGTTPTNDKYVGYDWQDSKGQRLVYFGVDYRADGIKRLELQKRDANLTSWLIQFAPIFTDVVTTQYNGNAKYKSVCSGYTKGTAPTINQFGGVSTYDKNNVEVASVYSRVSTDNTVTSALLVKQPTATGTGSKSLSIWCDKNGVFHSYCGVQSNENNSIVTTVSHGSNYVRFGNGLQICWGSGTGVQTFPQPFKDANYMIADSDLTYHKYEAMWTSDKTTTQFKINNSGNAQWIAIGYWY